jgi:hypothetical protein
MRKAAFLDILADATGIDRARLDFVARALNAGGVTPRAMGGPNAPHVTPRDAAAFVLAVLATDAPSRAAEAARRFAGMPHDARASRGDVPPEFGDVAGMTALEFVEHVIGADKFFTPLHVAGFFLELDRNAKRMVAWHGEKLQAQHSVVWRDWRAEDRQDAYGIRVRAGLATVDLAKVIGPFWRERDADGPGGVAC